MTLQDYILQVLVEENPYVHCLDIRDRPITYEDVAVNIAFDIQEDPSLDTEKVVRYWLYTEFGKDVYEDLAKRTIFRIKQMTGQENFKLGF